MQSPIRSLAAQLFAHTLTRISSGDFHSLFQIRVSIIHLPLIQADSYPRCGWGLLGRDRRALTMLLRRSGSQLIEHLLPEHHLTMLILYITLLQ